MWQTAQFHGGATFCNFPHHEHMNAYNLMSSSSNEANLRTTVLHGSGFRVASCAFEMISK